MEAVDVFIEGAAGKIAVRAKGLDNGPRAAIVMVQGALLPGQTAYDYCGSGPSDLSLLNVCSGWGMAAVTFSVRGFGESDPPEDPNGFGTIEGIEDLEAVIAWTKAQTGLDKVSILAWSWGARVAGRYTEDHDDVDRLILMDGALGGNPPRPELEPKEDWRPHLYENFIERVEPQFTDPAFAEELAQYIAAHNPRSPVGPGREATLGPTPINPERITRPTMLIYGETAARAFYMDGNVTREEFVGLLNTGDRSLVIVPDAGDYMQFQHGRHRFHRYLHAFLSPVLVDAAT